MKTIIYIVGIIISIWYMKKVRSAVLKGTVSDIPLTTGEKIFLWILFIIANPIWNGMIFYYGWKSTLPIKARQVKKIAWIVLGIYLLAIIIIFLTVLVPMRKISSMPNATMNSVSTSVPNSSLKEYKNDDIGISFQYPDKYGDVFIKKIPDTKGFAYLGGFTKSNPNFAPYFFGGKSIDNQTINHMPSSIDDTVESYEDTVKIKISDISGVNTTGIILSDPQSSPNWREVIFKGNKTILNLVFFSRLDVVPEYLDIVKTVKVY